jgi:acyl-CoA thioester hydrolase
MSEILAAPCGRIVDGTHVFPVRVYYEDTDAIGIVYYANYLKWAERARTEMLRVLGADHSRVLEETGVAFAVRRCTVEYDAPARLDDDLEVLSRITDIGGASIGFEQVVHRPPGTGRDGAQPLVRLSLTVCCLNRAGRPVRMPPSVRAALAAVQDARGQG